MAHEHSHDAHGAAHGSTKSYGIGFILSVILTVIPFALVMFPSFSKATILLAIVVMGLVQIFVHLVYFLHMNTSSEQSWNVIAFVFTILISVILIGLSVWIIFSMHSFMLGH